MASHAGLPLRDLPHQGASRLLKRDDARSSAVTLGIGYDGGPARLHHCNANYEHPSQFRVANE